MQRRTDALGALGRGRDWLDCLCDVDDCPAAAEKQRAAEVVIHLLANQSTLDGTSDDPGYLPGFGIRSSEVLPPLGKQVPGLVGRRRMTDRPQAALDAVKIQARAVIPIVRALEREISKARAHSIVGRAIAESYAEWQGKAVGARNTHPREVKLNTEKQFP